MGIKPEGDNPIIVPPDNIQSRWGAWEADLDAAGQVAGEVHLETWSLANSANEWISDNSHKVQGLLEDSRGLGDDSRTIQEQMRELIDPENPDSELWILQSEVDKLQDDRNDLQDQMIALNRQDIDEQAQYTSRFLFVPGFTGASDDYFSVTPASNGRWRVEAKSSGPAAGWTGRYTLMSAYMNNGNFEPVIDYREVPNSNPSSPRVQFHNGAEYSTIINYWVRNAIHRVDDKETGSYTSGEWTTRNDLTFTAPMTADYAIYYRVTWNAADYGSTYGHRVLRNGTEIMRWGLSSRVGPTFPWESGVRTRTLSHMAVPLREGDVVTFQTYSSAPQTAQRAVRSSERKISWMMPATQGNTNASGVYTLTTTAGTAGFTRTDQYPEINWVWDNAIKFPNFAVTADRTVQAENDEWDLVEFAPGTRIPAGRTITALADYAGSVTFTRD